LNPFPKQSNIQKAIKAYKCLLNILLHPPIGHKNYVFL